MATQQTVDVHEKQKSINITQEIFVQISSNAFFTSGKMSIKHFLTKYYGNMCFQDDQTIVAIEIKKT